MSDVNSRMSQDGKQLIIEVSGRFDYSVHREFRGAYVEAPPPAAGYVIDLARTEYMDSSALGMVLLLREHAGGAKARVELRNARPEVQKILRIANFDKLLTLKGPLA